MHMAPRRTRPSSALVDDTIIDVLLRLPPEEPAHLVRASLVCKQWRRVLSDPEFLRLYARLHRIPPLLGFFTLCSSHPYSGPVPCFVPIPTTAAGSGSPSSSVAAAGGAPLAIDHCPWLVWDCRHGRVLLQRRYVAEDARALLVWDPITGDRHELPWLHTASAWSAVVLCAAAKDGCDHSGSRGGPFLVLCADVGTHRTARCRARVRVYSSQLRAWSAPVHLDLLGFQHFYQSRAVVIGGQVYMFPSFLGDRILKYDLGRHCLSAINSTGIYGMDADVKLMATEEGLLGLAGTSGSTLHLWSRTANNARWKQSRVIDLRTMMISSPPAGAGNDDIERATVIAFAEGANAILVGTNAGTFVIDLMSERAKKISDTWIRYPVVPFMTFYSPDWACQKSPLPAETD